MAAQPTNDYPRSFTADTRQYAAARSHSEASTRLAAVLGLDVGRLTALREQHEQPRYPLCSTGLLE